MQHVISQKPDFAIVRVVFDYPGEELLVESAAMVAKDTALLMKTQMRGGVLAAAKRKMLGGESIFQNAFAATAPGQRLYLAPGPEGDIEAVECRPGAPVFLSSGAFLASTPGVVLDTKWGGAKGFFSGAGLFLLKAEGMGPLFFAAYGGIHAVDVGPTGYVCDTNHIVGFTAGLSYQISKVGGIKGLFLSGEGLVCRFHGQGRLWLSTRDPGALASFVHPFRRVKSSD